MHTQRRVSIYRLRGRKAGDPGVLFPASLVLRTGNNPSEILSWNMKIRAQSKLCRPWIRVYLLNIIIFDADYGMSTRICFVKSVN